jgi:hypothetical protein
MGKRKKQILFEILGDVCLLLLGEKEAIFLEESVMSVTDRDRPI